MKESICPNCGYIGRRKTVTRGGCFIELVLWLFFLLPGLLYSVWRLSSKYKVCPHCESEAAFVPVSSPRGQKLLLALRPGSVV